MLLLELACFSASSALTACASGADRIELCADYTVGGTTPTAETLARVRSSTRVPVVVMIRPRGGDFVYSAEEFAEMLRSISRLRELGADGFVFGVLSADERVDVLRTAELVRAAGRLPCTFHRAFDQVRNPVQGLEDVVSAGCKALLTAGGRGDAIEGLEPLKMLVERADGRLQVVVGGGVRSSNLLRARKETGAKAFHSSALSPGASEVVAEEVQRMKQQLLLLSD